MNSGYNVGIPSERSVSPIGHYPMTALLFAVAIVSGRSDDFKPTPPGECRIEARFSNKDGIRSATATLRFRFKTTRSLQAIDLGMAGAVITSTTFEGVRERPDLMANEGGITIRPKVAGEYELTVEVEPTIDIRNGGTDRGWSLPLPGAVITTFSVAAGPETPGELTITSFSNTGTSLVKRLSSTKSRTTLALGTAERVDCTWVGGPIAANARERIDSQIDVTAKETTVSEIHRLKVFTTRKQWDVALPTGSNLVVDPVDDRRDVVRISMVNPSRARVELPESGEWIFIASKSSARNDGSVGAIVPIQIDGIADHVGRIRLLAESTSRLEPTGKNRTRMIEERDPISGKAELRYAFVANDDQPLLTYRTIRRPSSIRSRPVHRLSLVEQQWQWRASFRLTPRYREVRDFELHVPNGWSTVRIGPDDSIDEIATNEQSDGSRRLTIRMSSASLEPIELTMDASYPVGLAKETTVPMPYLKDVIESDGRVIVTVPEPSVVSCVVRSGDRDVIPVQEGTSDIEPRSRSTVVSTLPIESIRIRRSVERPRLHARLTAEAVLHDRQFVIQQTIQLRADGPYPRPIRLTIPADAVGFRVQPSPIAAQSGSVLVAWPASQSEFTLTLLYALPRPGDISLVWPDDATETIATIHAWGMPGTRLRPPSSQWNVEPMTAIPNRPTYPWLSLTATRSAEMPPPVWRPIEEPVDADDAPDVTIETVAVAIWPHEDRRYRMRCLLSSRIASGFNVSLPDPDDIEIWIDGRRLESLIPTATQLRDGYLTVRLFWPESRSTTPAILEFRGRRKLPIIERAQLRTSVRWIFAQDRRSWILPYDRDLVNASNWTFRAGRFSLTDDGGDSRLIPTDSDWPRLNDDPTARSSQLDRWPLFFSLDRWTAFVPATLIPVFLALWGYRQSRRHVGRLILVLSVLVTLLASWMPLTAMQLVEVSQYGIAAAIFVTMVSMIKSRIAQRLPSFAFRDVRNDRPGEGTDSRTTTRIVSGASN